MSSLKEKYERYGQLKRVLNTRKDEKHLDRLSTIFDLDYRRKRNSMDRLKRFVALKKKRRDINFKAIQILLNKYLSMSLFHWQNIYKFKMKRAK